MRFSLKTWSWVLGTAMILIVALVVWNLNPFKFRNNTEESVPNVEVVPPTVEEFGMVVNGLEIVRHEVKTGETFSTIMDQHGLQKAQLFALAEKAQGVLDLRRIKAGELFHFYKDPNDSVYPFKSMVYQEDAVNFVRIDLGDSIRAVRQKKEVLTRKRWVSATVYSSLYNALAEKGTSPDLVMRIADLYAWSIDFFRIQNGDRLVVEYEEILVDDTVFVGHGRILAARFQHAGRDYDAYRFEADTGFVDYYDQEGRSLKKAFLKAPLNFFRISSKYNMNRLHPVLKRVKPHLGTDYAAPTGTPIMSTADGVVDQASYTAGNGNFVKVRHNDVYSTQYLHMSKIAKGIRPGTRVRQGDVIGFVGSTGLATGPHVCYRFWKNGVQVDPFKEKLPEAQSIHESYKQAFMQLVASYQSKLDDLIKREMLVDLGIAEAGL